MKSDFKELLKHAKHYVSAEFFSKGLGFLTIPIFTRLLNPSEYGILAIYISLVSISTIIFGLGFRGSVERFYFEDRKSFFDFLSSNFWFLSITGLILGTIAVLFREQIILIFNIPYPLICIGILVAFLLSLIEIFQSYFIASKRSRSLSITTALQATMIVTLSIVLMLNLDTERYYGRAFAELVTAILLFGYFLFDVRKNLKFRIVPSQIKYSLIFGIPIVFHLLSQSVLNMVDQIIINQLVGERETGIYALAYRVGMIQSIISMGILKAWTPILYDKMNLKKYTDIDSLAQKYAWIICSVTIGLMLFSSEIVFIVADKSFFEARPMIPIVILGYFFFFLYTMYVGFAFYHKKTGLISIFTIVAGVANIVLNYWLIPHFGYMVAAWTTTISYALLLLLHYVNVRWVIKGEFIMSYQVFVFPLILVAAVFTIRINLDMNSYIQDISMRLFIFILALGVISWKARDYFFPLKS